MPSLRELGCKDGAPEYLFKSIGPFLAINIKGKHQWNANLRWLVKMANEDIAAELGQKSKELKDMLKDLKRPWRLGSSLSKRPRRA